MPVNTKAIFDPKKFSKLQALKCFPEVYKLLCDGYPYSQVVSFIQNDRGEYTGVQPRTLEKLLLDFKKQMIPEDHKVTYPESSKIRKIQQRTESTDLVEEMRSLYYIQLSRVEIATRVEEENGHLIEGAGREVKIASDLLMRLAKLIDREEDQKDDSELYRELEDGAQASIVAEKATGMDARFLQDPAKRQQFLELVAKLQDTDVILDLADEEDDDEEEVSVEAGA